MCRVLHIRLPNSGMLCDAQVVGRESKLRDGWGTGLAGSLKSYCAEEHSAKESLTSCYRGKTGTNNCWLKPLEITAWDIQCSYLHRRSVWRNTHFLPWEKIASMSQISRFEWIFLQVIKALGRVCVSIAGNFITGWAKHMGSVETCWENPEESLML